MKHIILTTDLSNEATAAFPVAKQLAKAFEAKIELLTIVEDLTQAAVMYALDYPVRPSQEIVEQFMERVQSDLGEIAENEFTENEVSCTLLEANGSVPSTIREHATSQGADLIIMSTHGQAGKLSKIFIGSVAERVVREAPCPVLTVPMTKSV